MIGVPAARKTTVFKKRKMAAFTYNSGGYLKSLPYRRRMKPQSSSSV
jgi:hypothetical protein